MSMDRIKAAVKAAKGNARQMGEVVQMIAENDSHAAEIIAADLDNPEMGLDKCFEALREYARKHQQGGFWGCMVSGYDTENPVIKFVYDFYKVQPDKRAESPKQPKTQAIGDELDLLSLL